MRKKRKNRDRKHTHAPPWYSQQTKPKKPKLLYSVNDRAIVGQYFVECDDGTCPF